MNYNFYFKDEKDTLYFVHRALEIAKQYGRVTLSDLYDLNGAQGFYAYNKIGWTASSISNEVYTNFNSYLKCYVVLFPKPDFNKVDYNKGETFTTPKSYVIKRESETSSEPLNITICMDLFESHLDVAHQIFNMTNKIKDRPVFITIS